MKTVLVVEDDVKSRKLLVDVLANEGYRVVDTGNGEVALELARSDRPDLVLMDIHMPGIDGLEVLARMRADPALASIPAVAVTASVMPRETARILAAGFERLLPKPFDLPQLLALVGQLTGLDESDELLPSST